MASSKKPLAYDLGGPSNDPPQSRLRVNNAAFDQEAQQRIASAGMARTASFGADGQASNLHNNRQFREAQASYEEQIQALEGDKVSLMKRLNMVLSELESATHEKAAIGLRVADQERQAEELKRKLDEAASLKQVVNRDLQQQLCYERELNQRMHDELQRFEAEKESIFGKLKDTERVSEEFQRESNLIKANLQRKKDDLTRIEREHEENIQRLRELTHQLESLRGQEMHGKGEKRRLEDELGELTREKENLLRRMQDLGTRFDEYVTNMERERLEITRANKNHIKLLTAKLFFQTFSDMLRIRRKESFQAMQSCSHQLKKVETIVQRFVRVLSEHHTDAKRRYLKEWYRKAMDFTHENYKKLNLIDYNVAKKRKIRFFYKWRALFQKREREAESKMHAVARLAKLTITSQNLVLRNKLCRWRDFVELRQYQGSALDSVLSRFKRREQRSAFVHWLARVKSEQLQKRYETMSHLISEMTFKQRVFMCLRQACISQRCERTQEKFTQWKAKCEVARDRKYYLKKKLMIERLQGVRTERLLKQVFDGIRYCNVLEKYEATKARLGQEIPIRMELEVKRDQMIKSHRMKDKYNMLRKCCIRYADAKYRALMVWKENIAYFKRVMGRTKLRLIELHRRNLAKAFLRWREGSSRKTLLTLLGTTDDLLNENQELKNTLEACYLEEERLQQCKFRQQSLKVERLRNLLNRNACKKAVDVWASNAWWIRAIESAVWKGTKTIERRRLRNAFARYKLKVKEVKREAYVMERVQWFEQARGRKTKDLSFDAWVSAIKRWKNARTFLLRSIKGVDRLITNEAFTTWKTTLYTYRRDFYHGEIAELTRRQGEHEQQISELNREIQINDSSRCHLESKLQSQSHKILANFVARFVHSNQARGFYTWVETLRDTKTKGRFMYSTLTYWVKQHQGRAFRSWAESTLAARERELAEDLEQKRGERKELERIKDEEDLAQAREIETLSSNLDHAIQVRDSLQVNYEKAMNTHISRVRNNVYVNKRRNIFCIWAEYVKKEKNAVNLIGAIARRQLRMEVFSRIRLVARERFLEANAERVCNNLFTLLKRNILTKSFSKWRVRSYTDVVREMYARRDHLIATRNRHIKECEIMEQHKQAKAFKILKQQKQRDVSNAWITLAKTLKTLRVKRELCESNLKYIQAKNATQKWMQRVKVTQYLRRKQQVALEIFKKRTLTQCYKQWHLRVQICKTLLKKAFKFGRRIQCLSMAEGFGQIVHFTKSFKERDRERKEHAVQSSFKILSRLMKKRLCDTFQDLRVRAQKKNFKQEYMARMLRHVLASRMRHFFGKWRHNSNRIALAETVNTEGDVVLERNEVRRNVKALKDFLGTQGYSNDDIGQYLTNKSDNQKQKMHRAIVGLFFRNSDFEIIPKALNQWKRWVQQRRLVKQWSRYCVNAMNHPLHWAFRKWKMGEEDAREKLKNVLKKDLVKKIIDDEMAIGSAQHRLERMDEQIENLGIQRDSLLQHYIAGQRLALALGRNNQQRTLFRAFLRWKKETRDREQYLLLQQLKNTNIMIQDLMSHVNRLEGIHSNLVQENDELRQAAMDGIEIAKAVQDLTREREMLSQDLQERASTIKRLIDDNNILAHRLSVAQKEAEQLEDLNREALQGQSAVKNGCGAARGSSSNPPAERDRYC